MASSGPFSFLTKFLEPFTGTGQLRLEKARLEAFLSAVPGEYCGWAKDGSVAYSDNFCNLLDLTNIEKIYDIQDALTTSDSAVLEGMFHRLEDNQKPFSITVQSRDEKKVFRISGKIGTDLSEEDQFHILWIEDITTQAQDKRALEDARNNSERELKNLQTQLDTFPDPVWIRDSYNDLMWCNKAYADYVNETPASAIARQAEIILSSKSRNQSIKDLAQNALKEGCLQSLESHVIFGGSRKKIYVTEMPVPGSNQTMGFMRDITNEEHLENELKRYVSAHKELLQQLRTAIALYNPDHTLEFYNSTFSQLWELEEQWLNSKPKLGDIMEKLREDRNLPEQADFRSYKNSWLKMFTDLIDPFEDMLYLPKGTALRMLVVPHPMGGLMMTFEDVTGSLELQSSYNTLIAVQKETLDNLAEGVAVYGEDGRLKLSNPAFTNLWKLNPEDIDSNPHITRVVDKMEKLFHKKDWDTKRTKLVSHGLDRKIHDGRIIRKDKNEIKYTTVPLPDGGVLVTYIDITDSSRVENALREKNAALEAAEQLKTDFLANVSYQLRTPLNAIMGFSEILDNQYFGDLNNKQREYTGGIQEAGDRLLSLINDILDLSTIEAGYLELKQDNMDIYTMLQGLYTLTRDWARKENLEVRLDCEKDIGSIIGDEQRIKQALLNLVRNAITFTPKGGTITLSAANSKNAIQLMVTDTGIGIPKEEQEKIFEPFQRAVPKGIGAENLQIKQRGAGLGLSLVKNIVELHNGKIEINSAENKGTSFKITLPVKASKQKAA